MSTLEVEERVRLALLVDAVRNTIEAEIHRMHPDLYTDGIDVGLREAAFSLEVTMKWLVDLRCYETLPDG